MEITTIDFWDEELWQKAKVIYHQAFDDKGGKPLKVIRNMFKKELCFLHLCLEDEKVVAMALTGRLKSSRTLIIDYLAVEEENRNKGIGQHFFDHIKEWASRDSRFNKIIIEVESENSPENQHRIDFWKKCGFCLTEYIHQYIWVPEPYQAMYVNLTREANQSNNGEELFTIISEFHKLSFQGIN